MVDKEQYPESQEDLKPTVTNVFTDMILSLPTLIICACLQFNLLLIV